MRVKPANPGAVIRDPQTKRRLPDEGASVPDTNFWHRRVRAGDVVLVEEEPAAREAPTGREPVTPLTTREEKPR